MAMIRCVATGRIMARLCLLAVIGSLAWYICLHPSATLAADSDP